MIKLPIKLQKLKVMSQAFWKENSKHGIQIENAQCLIFQVKKFYVASRCADPHNWCGIKCCKNVNAIHFVNSFCTIFRFWKKDSPHHTFPSYSELTSAVSSWKQDPCAELFTKWMDFRCFSAGFQISTLTILASWYGGQCRYRYLL